MSNLRHVFVTSKDRLCVQESRQYLSANKVQRAVVKRSLDMRIFIDREGGGWKIAFLSRMSFRASLIKYN